MSLLEEVGARLSLRDRPKFTAEADAAARSVRTIGHASEEASVESVGAFGRMTAAAGAFGATALRVLKYSVVGGLLAVGGAFYEGTKQAMDYQKVQAQTTAVLKSTGQQAGVTAQNVEDLASKIERHTAYSDEAVQTTENLLLTFRKVHNETGRGNDIFNRATVSIGNMATAMGGDMHRATIMVGKALNDPIKGLSAMSRVGVTFTAQQTDQVKALVASGNSLQAQKLILGELRKEFGGSAVAAGQTFSGSLSRARNELMRLFREVATPVIPYFTKALGGLADLVAGPVTSGLSKVKTGISLFAAGVKSADVGPVTDLKSGLYAAGGEVRRFWAGLTGGQLSGKAKDGFYQVARTVRTLAGDVIDLGRKALPIIVKYVKGDLIPIVRNLIRFLEPELTNTLMFAARVAKVLLGGAFVVLAHILTGVVGPGLKAVTGFMADHKTIIQAVMVTVGAFVLLMKLQALWTLTVSKATLAWSLATKAAAFATNTLKVGVWLLNTAFAANPIGVVVALIIALAAGFIYAYKHSETFRNIVQGAFHGVAVAAKFVWNWLKSNWPYLFAILLGPFGLVVGAIIKHWGGVTSFFKSIPSILKALGADIANALTAPFRLAFNAIADGWNATIGRIHLHIPSWVPHYGGKGFDMPQLPHWNAIVVGGGGGDAAPAPVSSYAPGMARMHSGGTTVRDQYVNLQPSEEIVALPGGTTVVPLDAPTVASVLGDRGGNDGPQIIQLVVDGKVLAETVHKRTRDKVARS